MSKEMYNALLDSKTKIEEELNELKSWLSKAISLKYGGRGRTDQVAWRAKQEALSQKKMEHQFIQIQLGKLRRSGEHIDVHRKTADKRRLFIKLCETRFGKESVDEIWNIINSGIE